MSSTFEKDPAAVLDWQIDWSAWLAEAEEVTTSTWTVSDAELEIASSTSTTTTATVWLRAGVAPTSYVVTNKVVTNQGRTDQRSIRVDVVER